MLFKFTQGSLIQANPEIKSVDEFIELTEKEIRYVMLYADIKSPYRRIPSEERKEKLIRVCRFVDDNNKITPQGRDIIKGRNKKVNSAITTYRELQGWSEIQMLEGVDASLRRINSELKNKATDLDDLIKMNKALPGLLTIRQEISEMLDPDEETEESKALDDTSSLSKIDRINSTHA